MNQIKDYILEQVSQKALKPEKALKLLSELEQARDKNQKIAIIGMACDLPEAKNYEEFWNNLFNERECLGYIPREFEDYYKVVEDPRFAEAMGTEPVDLKEEHFSSRSAYIKDADRFDAAFFGIAPREARYMDPSQRVFLETACASIEDAGYSLQELMGSSIGVFVGKDHNRAEFYKLSTKPDTLSTTGSWHGILASRISYIFNFRGPAMVIDTACSSGLVSVHEACRALQAGDCDMAIAGGIAVGGFSSSKKDGEEASDALESVASPDSTVRPFDKKSAGTVFGEGCVALLLKPLSKAIEDGDNIHGVIVSSAANNDGASNGITAPNPAAQTDVICKAWENSEVDPRMISYVETHGTGTLLGDPIEFKALNNAFRRYSNDKQFCGIGSAKSNVGHLIAASGCAGIMKVVLAMQHRYLPASINFEEPNPHINFLDSALYVVDKTEPWGESGETLYAGVSSFGFSGTNAHVLLESAEKYQNKNLGSNKKPRILTLSAKSEWSLTQLIDRLAAFVNSDRDIDLDSVCATALLGRGHYNYRVAITFQDYDELNKKLMNLNWRGLDTKYDGVYFGSFKVVSDRKTERSKYEFTESEIKKTNLSAQAVLEKIKNGEESIENYNLLCEYYIQGATIKFRNLYSGAIPHKIPMPTYPFERTIYWADVKQMTSGGSGLNGQMIGLPLIDRCLLRSIEQDVYTTNFSVNKHWILHDHVIMGKNIIPGMAYVELGYEACSMYIDGAMELRDLVFLTPLGVEPDEEAEAQIIVKKLKNHVEFVVATGKKNEEDDEVTWVKHVEGKAYKLESKERPEHLDLDVLNDPKLMSRAVALAPLGTPNAPMCFGPRWNNVRRVYISPEYNYVDVRLADEFTDDLKHFSYHSSILDEAVNAGVLAAKEQVYLPFMLKHIKLYQPLPQTVFSRAICRDEAGKSDEISTYDVTLYDESGNVLVEITDYSVKKVHKFHNYEDKIYYKTKWIAVERPEGTEESLGTVLLFGSNHLASALYDEINKRSTQVISVNSGFEFKKIDDKTFIIGNAENDYQKLCAEIADYGINTIIHAGSFEPKRSSQDVSLNIELDNGVYQLFLFVKEAVKSKIRGRIHVVVLTDHAVAADGTEQTVIPANTALVGIARCISQEYPNLETKIIDADEYTSDDDLLAELSYYGKNDVFTVLRGKNRYEESLVKFERTAQMDEVPVNLKDGCALITGGTGGLGLEVAKYLAEREVRTICLTGRHELPTEDTWQSIIQNNPDGKLAKTLSTILAIREKGINIFAKSVNVSDELGMEALISELENDYGCVSVVIHCAGVAGDGFIVNKPFDTFKNVLAPKVAGTHILNHLLDWNKMQLFVAFSSMTSFFGGPGQSDYTAANSFLDGFAAQSALLNKPVVTVNWPAWSETGMAVDYNVMNARTMFRSLDNKTAIGYLNDAISYRLQRVIPGEINYDVLALDPESARMRMERSIQRAIEIRQKKLANEADANNRGKNIQEIVLLGKTDDYTETEKLVAYIYAGVLDIKEIDIYDNYNSLGGNSMTSTEILKMLNQYFDGMLEVSDVFSYPTVVEMAEYIDNKRNEQKQIKEKQEDMNTLIDQLENGEIEVDKMLEMFNDD